MINTNLQLRKPIGKVERKQCIVCKGIFHTPTEDSVQHQRQTGLRSRRSITCSPRCAKIYFRHKKTYKLKKLSYSTQKRK